MLILEECMNTRTLALGGLILLAALSRLLPHPPNFAPITAMAVFGGIVYRHRTAAVIAPLLALLLSDLVIEVLYRNGLAPRLGLYRGMWWIYATSALVALLSILARGTRSPVVIAAMTLCGSCVFFLLSNFVFWAETDSYPHTIAGLAACYTAGIPFFRNTVLGDVTYTAILFGVWLLAEARFPILRPASAVTNA
jgi:hypothetical protein